MAKKKSDKAHGYKRKTINIKPFDDMNTDDARGKAVDRILKEIESNMKKREFFENPQSPRA